MTLFKQMRETQIRREREHIVHAQKRVQGIDGLDGEEFHRLGTVNVVGGSDIVVMMVAVFVVYVWVMLLLMGVMGVVRRRRGQGRLERVNHQLFGLF